jgi:hypothetical protein
MDEAAPKTGGHVDDKTLRTLGQVLRDTYKAQVNPELPPELAALLQRMRARMDGA